MHTIENSRTVGTRLARMIGEMIERDGHITPNDVWWEYPSQAKIIFERLELRGFVRREKDRYVLAPDLPSWVLENVRGGC